LDLEALQTLTLAFVHYNFISFKTKMTPPARDPITKTAPGNVNISNETTTAQSAISYSRLLVDEQRRRQIMEQCHQHVVQSMRAENEDLRNEIITLLAKMEVNPILAASHPLYYPN
jgi:hypothetical protein